jgi:uncharacterized integral membrane protein
MAFWKDYIRHVLPAFWHALALTDTLVIGVFIAAGISAAAFGFFGGHAEHPSWWIALAIFLVSLLVLLIRMPYRLYAQQRATINALNNQLARITEDSSRPIFPDMLLVDLVKRIVGSDDLFVGENCSKCGDALRSIRENAHLGKITVWGRKNVLSKDLALYPLTSIPAEYWDEFGIEYLLFTDDQKGKTNRERGAKKSERVPSTIMTTIHVVEIPDTIYSDLRFCAHQVEKSWPSSI